MFDVEMDLVCLEMVQNGACSDLGYSKPYKLVLVGYGQVVTAVGRQKRKLICFTEKELNQPASFI